MSAALKEEMKAWGKRNLKNNGLMPHSNAFGMMAALNFLDAGTYAVFSFTEQYINIYIYSTPTSIGQRFASCFSCLQATTLILGEQTSDQIDELILNVHKHSPETKEATCLAFGALRPWAKMVKHRRRCTEYAA